MHLPDPTFQEYPKWVGNVVVASAAEEQAVRAAEAAVCEIRRMDERKAGQLLAEREKGKAKASGSNPTSGIIAAVRAEAVPAAAEPARPPSSAGGRMRRMRERRRNGKRSITLDMSPVQIESLVHGGFLGASMRDDAAEIALGIGRLLDRVTA
jgi:hypothetical protein